MKKIMLFLSLFATCVSASAGNYNDKKIGAVRSVDWRPCMFFQLQGVSQADSTGSPWFALSNTHIGYKEILSMIISSKMADKAIHVTTTSNTVCGHAEVQVIQLP